MQMRGNLHRYRVSPSGKRNRMLQGTYVPSYRPVLKFAAYGLLYTLLKEIITDSEEDHRWDELSLPRQS